MLSEAWIAVNRIPQVEARADSSGTASGVTDGSRLASRNRSMSLAVERSAPAPASAGKLEPRHRPAPAGVAHGQPGGLLLRGSTTVSGRARGWQIRPRTSRSDGWPAASASASPSSPAPRLEYRTRSPGRRRSLVRAKPS